MKNINIHYFAILRDFAGKEREELTTDLSSYKELYQFLSEKYSFNLPAEMIQIAVNDEFDDLNSQIKSNAKIVFIPPVAGG